MLKWNVFAEASLRLCMCVETIRGRIFIAIDMHNRENEDLRAHNCTQLSFENVGHSLNFQCQLTQRNPKHTRCKPHQMAIHRMNMKWLVPPSVSILSFELRIGFCVRQRQYFVMTCVCDDFGWLHAGKDAISLARSVSRCQTVGVPCIYYFTRPNIERNKALLLAKREKFSTVKQKANENQNE